MARYVVNTRGRKVHEADCRFAGTQLLPWPRFPDVRDKPCRWCLPSGLPLKAIR